MNRAGDCSFCHGRGETFNVMCERWEECWSCDGTGTCRWCSGKGELPDCSGDPAPCNCDDSAKWWNQ